MGEIWKIGIMEKKAPGPGVLIIIPLFQHSILPDKDFSVN
jgi:hypothetical protein